MTQHNRETLLVLADRWDRTGISAAKQAASSEVWYRDERCDLAHAANCFTVAAALRARATLDLTGEKA